MGKRKTHEEFEKEFYKAHPNYKLLSKYQGVRTPIKILCDKKHIWETQPNIAIKCNCGECHKLFKYNQKTTDSFKKELIENGIKATPLEEYKGARVKIWFQCLECKEHKFQSTPDNLLNKTKRCVLCANKIGGENHRKSITNKNNLFSTVHPEYVKYLIEPNLADKYSYGSHKKVKWKCFDCNNTYMQSFKEISNRGAVCPYCSKWKSYPNNFMKNILNQLNVEYIAEYSPDWIKPKRFDFYIPSVNTIIEMDGAFHYIERQKSNLTLEEVVSIDEYKEKCAIEHGIDVIRIDSYYYSFSTRQSYISKNILESKLSHVFDFKNVNFDEANIYALTPSFKRVCELWNNGNHNINGIAKQLNVDYTTALRCLKYGEEIGICDYVLSEQKERQRIISAKIGAESGQPVLCNETGKVFSSMTKASEFYHCNLYNYFKRNSKYCGQLSNGTKLTWIKISKQEYENIKSRAS